MHDKTTIDDAEDLDLFMLMFNLIEYSSNHSETIGSLRFYSKHEGTNFSANTANNDNFKSFEYETKLLENTQKAQPAQNNANGILENATITVPLKYLNSFWTSLQMPPINCKIELKHKWTKYCVLPAAGNDNTNANPNDIIFTIKDTKLYVPTETLSARGN